MSGVSGGGGLGGGNMLQLLCVINEAAPNLVSLLNNKDQILQLAKDTYTVSQSEIEKSDQIIADIESHQTILDGLKQQISNINTAKTQLASDQTALQTSQAEVVTQKADFEDRESKIVAAETAYKTNLSTITAAQAQLATDQQKLTDDKAAFVQEKADFETYASSIKAKAAQIQGLTADLVNNP